MKMVDRSGGSVSFGGSATSPIGNFKSFGIKVEKHIFQGSLPCPL